MNARSPLFLRITSATAFVCMLILASNCIWVQSPDSKASDNPAEKESKPADESLRKAEVQFLSDAIKHFEIEIGDDRAPSRQLPEPVLVYNNPVSGTKLGVLGVFTRHGRPDVICQLAFSAPQAVYTEFHNLCADKVTMKRESNIIWAPPETSTKWVPLEGAEKPADTAPLRLVQMRRLAQKFVVEDDFGGDKKERHELRLLTTPVYRYGKPGEETVDGAVFVYALGTDPEAILVLECVKRNDVLSWQYGFGPSSIYALTAKLDGNVVWQIGERREFSRRNSIQFVSGYKLAEGEKYPE